MSALLDVLFDMTFTLLRAGFRRASRDPRPIARVASTYWHLFAVVALGAQAVIILIAVLALGRLALQLFDDSLLLFLALILVPAVMVGMAFGLATIGWIIGTVRKVVGCDASARLELVVTGIVGGLIGAWLAYDTGSLWAIAFLAPSLATLMVACLPSAWIPESDPPYPFDS